MCKEPSQERQIPIVLILGKGRSGTTWLGDLLNTDPDAIYKFEPFLPTKHTPFLDWVADLDSGDNDELRSRFIELCCKCFHGIDMPPFVPKSFRPHNKQILHLLYGMGHRVKHARKAYEWYAQPRLNSHVRVLVKHVNWPNEKLARLCDVLHPYLLCVVRNPFANIASFLRGVELGLFKRDIHADIKRTREVIDHIGSYAFTPYRDYLEEMPIAGFEALRWRIETEPLAEFTTNYARGLVVVYEQLCTEPIKTMQRIVTHIGWEFSNEMREHINTTTYGERRTGNDRKAYYSVYRDPRASMSKWKTQLDADQCSAIVDVVRGTPLKNLWQGMLESGWDLLDENSDRN